MLRVPFRLIIALAAAALSLTLLSWSLWPPGRLIEQQLLPTNRTQLPGARILILDFPSVIRFGDDGRVQLTLENGDPAQASGIPNIYVDDNVLAEARLDIAGIAVRPAETVSEPLLPGQSVAFFWSVRPNELGRFKGTVWFYLRFIPKNGGSERRQTISAQAVEIESATLFGLQAEPARWLGVAGVFLSALLGFSFFVDALRWLWKKMRKSA